jgi:hypothetical protein
MDLTSRDTLAGSPDGPILPANLALGNVQSHVFAQRGADIVRAEQLAPLCAEKEPPMRSLGGDHSAACHFATA